MDGSIELGKIENKRSESVQRNTMDMQERARLFALENTYNSSHDNHSGRNLVTTKSQPAHLISSGIVRGGRNKLQNTKTT